MFWTSDVLKLRNVWDIGCPEISIIYQAQLTDWPVNRTSQDKKSHRVIETVFPSSAAGAVKVICPVDEFCTT